MYKLRDYQREAVEATVKHFRKTDESAVIVLPTGAGKSLVIAELARIARGKLLVLAHVKELVEQNHAKYESYGLKGAIFSAGLNRKETQEQVVFASVQSVSRNLDAFKHTFSLLVIDECHRVSDDEDSQYQQIISHLKQHNPRLKVLGLTATPYRLGTGWSYRYHYRGFCRGTEEKPFIHCIYELPLRYMIRKGYLTPPELVDAPVAQYDFSQLTAGSNGEFNSREVNELLVQHPRVTQSITEQVMELAQDRLGVMIFAATVEHAREVFSYLPADKSALLTGDTPGRERDRMIDAFKSQQLKFLVNVAVLTTGFDAPHVDLIAILRPTQSVSLYQQIVGRGLRLFPGKEDCLVIDYAGNGFDLFHPEVGDRKPSSDSEPVQVFCPGCGFANIFWGKTDSEGKVIEHFGRRCQGFMEDDEGNREQCDYRFRFKECPHCGAENDIAARRCQTCEQAIIDPDEQLKQALQLKNALVIRCSGISWLRKGDIFQIIYHDEEGSELKESFNFSRQAARQTFNLLFGKRINQGRNRAEFSTAQEVEACADQLPHPDFVVARKSGNYWRVSQRIFDYQGRYRKANALS